MPLCKLLLLNLLTRTGARPCVRASTLMLPNLLLRLLTTAITPDHVFVVPP